jgi:hypothetical protein
MSINFDQLSQEEKDSGVSQLHSALAGIGSGLIEIPKGLFSLGANLYDLGAGTNTALQVEQFFNGLNPFKEDAEAHTIGKITEAITNLGIPSTLGFKIASRLAKGAIEAKKSGTYFNLANKGLTEASNVAAEGNKAADIVKYGPTINKLSDAERIKSFAAGTIGAGLSDAAFVGDVKSMGTLGDIFGGPTQLDRSEDYDPARELINRVKFGTESALFSGLIGGTGSTISKLRDRNWTANPASDLDKFFAPIVYGLRPGGKDPAEIFMSKLNKINNIKADTEAARMNIDAMFPEVKNILNLQTTEQKKETLNILNDLLISGRPEANEVGVFNFGKIDEDLKNKAINQIKKMGGKEENIENVLNGLEKTRDTWNSMFNTIGQSLTPKDLEKFTSIVGDQFKDHMGPTFSIFENKKLIPFLNYKPTEDSVNKLKNSFRDTALQKGIKLEEEQLTYFVDNILKGTEKNLAGTLNPLLKLPNFMLKKSMAGDAISLVEGNFLKDLPEQNKKVIEEYLGKKNPFENILNGTMKLSEIARRNQMFQEMKQSGIVFGEDNLQEAAKTFGLLKDGLPDISQLKQLNFKNVGGIEAAATHPLQGLYTRKDIADSLSDVFDAKPASSTAQFLKKAYDTFVLLPKFASQTAATVLNPFVQGKQLISNISMSTANGINPALSDFKELASFWKNSEKKDFLIRNGLFNTNSITGDLKDFERSIGLKLDPSNSLDYSNVFQSIANKLAKGKEFAETAYATADNIIKGTNLMAERNRLIKAYEQYGIQRSAKEIEQEAADIVRNTVQNYQMVGDFVKFTRNLPIGSFASYPSEILRTGTNIVDRAIYEITHEIKLADGTIVKPLAGIGYRRLTGMIATTAIEPAVTVAAAQAIYDVSEDQLDAMKRYVAKWSKNSTIIPLKDKETGEFKYVDFSHFNAYDTLYRPIQAAFNAVALGRKDHHGIMGDFIKGLASSTGEIASPLISESIWTQAVTDVFNKDGRTSDGKQIYNPEDTYGNKFFKSIAHVSSSLAPFGYKQLSRLGLSMYPSDSEGRFDERGNTYNFGDEAAGIAGLRAIKLDVPKALGYKVSQFDKEGNDARGLFYSEALKGGPVKPEDLVDNYINANRALYTLKSEMHKDLAAAKVLNIGEDDLREKTAKLPKKEYSDLQEGTFTPFTPSKNFEKVFQLNMDKLGVENSYELAKPIIENLKDQLSFQPLATGVFPKIENPLKNLPKPNLGPVSNAPSTPFSATTANSGTMNLNPIIAGQQVNPATKLTQNETALLSPTEQLIRQKQRQQQQIVS